MAVRTQNPEVFEAIVEWIPVSMIKLQRSATIGSLLIPTAELAAFLLETSRDQSPLQLVTLVVATADHDL